MRTPVDDREFSVAAEPAQLSIFAYGAAFSVMAALSITARGLPLLGVFALVILLSGFVRVRMSEKTTLRWVLRILLIGIIYFATPDRENGSADAIGSLHSRNLLGEIFAAEMMLQFWRRRSYDARLSNLIVMLTSALAFITACNTYETAYIYIIAPVYLFCVGSMARDYRARWPANSEGQRTRRPFLPNIYRSIALVAALLIGALASHIISDNRTLLTDLGNRLLAKDAWEGEMGSMSAQPQLGSAFGLRGSAARVLQIDGYAGDEHLCGFTYQTYERGRWGPSASELTWKTAPPHFLQTPRSKALGGPVSPMHVRRVASNNPLIYMPISTATLFVGDGVDVAHGSLDGGPFRVHAGNDSAYTVNIPPNDNFQGLFDAPLTAMNRSEYLALPPDADFDTIRRLAQRVGGRAKTPSRRVALITGYLLSHHKYSLEFRPSTQYRDPIADFLLSSPPQEGHCEFFATAACVMLRSLNIPTRYVTGYYAHESEGSTVVVRQRDAHAWCQAWIDGTGWVTVDATPGDGRPDALAEQTPIEPWRRAWERIQDAMQAITDHLANITSAQINVAIAAILIVTGCGWAYRVLRLRRAALVDAPGVALATYTASDPSLPTLALRFEAAWNRAARRALPPNQSYAEYLRTLRTSGVTTESALPDGLLAASEAFAAAYEAARFGSPIDAERRAGLVQMIEAIEAIEPVPVPEITGNRESNQTR